MLNFELQSKAHQPVDADITYRYDISIVVPLFNEAESLTELVEQIMDAISKSRLEELFGHRPSFEVLFINDGSNDGSDKIIKQLIAVHAEVKLISF